MYSIGNPCNNYSIREVATLMLNTAATMKKFAGSVKYTKLRHVKATQLYGEGYQDVQHGVPKITNTLRIWVGDRQYQ